MNKVLIISGPTASGKTSLGLELARKLNGRVISADSRAVYKELTIGSAKPTLNATRVVEEESEEGRIVWIDGIGHYTVNVANLNQVFTAANFVAMATKIIIYLHQNNILPIVVGGTGLYIEALRQGYDFPSPTNHYNPALAEEESRDSSLTPIITLKQQVSRLKDLDPLSAQKIDLNNPRRVERALTYVLATGKSFVESQNAIPPPWKFQTFVINHPRKKLYDRIDRGVDERVKMGMTEEVQGLVDKGYEKRLRKLGLEYKIITEYLVDAEQTQERLEEKLQELKYKIHAFARRQLTWWRKKSDIAWINSPKEIYDHLNL